MFLSPSIQGVRGVQFPPLDVRCIMRGSSLIKGQIAEFDWARTNALTTSLVAGKGDSVLVNGVTPTVVGARGARAHGILLGDIGQNEEGWVRIEGRVWIIVGLLPSGVSGNPMVVGTGTSNHRKRIKGVVLSSKTGWADTAWHGVEGIGQVYDPPAPSGGSSGPSGGSSGASGPSGPSGASEPSNGLSMISGGKRAEV